MGGENKDGGGEEEGREVAALNRRGAVVAALVSLTSQEQCSPSCQEQTAGSKWCSRVPGRSISGAVWSKL